MKKSLRIICLFALFIYAKPISAVGVDSAYVFSQYDSPDSSRCFLVAQVHIGSQPCSLQDTNIIHSADSIQISLCYTGGTALSLCYRTDIIDLGVKKNGVIHIHAIFKEYYNGQCTSSHLYKDTFDFTINSAITHISSIYNPLSEFRLTPNPATNQLNISIDESLIGAQLNIYNVTGSLVQSAQLQMPNSKFEIQNLPNGVYVVVVTTPKSPNGDFNTVMRRWVKM